MVYPPSLRPWSWQFLVIECICLCNFMKIRSNIIEGGLNRMSQREATKGFPGISGWVQYYVALCFCVGGNCIVMPVGRTSVNFDNRSRQHGPELSAYHTNTDTDRPRQSQGYLSVVGAVLVSSSLAVWQRSAAPWCGVHAFQPLQPAHTQHAVEHSYSVSYFNSVSDICRHQSASPLHPCFTLEGH